MNVPAPVTTKQETTTEQPTTANAQALQEQFNYHLHELRKLSREMSETPKSASIDDVAAAMQAYFEIKYEKKMAKLVAHSQRDADGPTGFFGRWGLGDGHGQDEIDKTFRKMHKKMARGGWLHPGAVPVATPAPMATPAPKPAPF